MGMQQAAEGETRRQRDVAQQQSATQQQNSREQGSGIIKVIALYPFLQGEPPAQGPGGQVERCTAR